VGEEGVGTEPERGVVPGAGLAPLLSKLYAPDVLDLGAHRWRTRHAHGPMSMGRYADDGGWGGQAHHDATRCRHALPARLALQEGT
jgi:hypothetical protein